jgi:hypothetical protein
MPPAAPVPAEFVIATSDYKMDGDIAGPVLLGCIKFSSA